MDRSAIIAAAVVVVAIIAIAVVCARRASGSRHGTYLTGMWVGDAGFLQRAQLSDIQLYISPADKDGSRDGYLIMADLAGAFIANDQLKILGTDRRIVKRDTSEMPKVSLQFTDAAATAAPPPLPSDASLTLSILDGSLTIKSDGKIQAFLTKDHSASAAALAVEA